MTSNDIWGYSLELCDFSQHTVYRYLTLDNDIVTQIGVQSCQTLFFFLRKMGKRSLQRSRKEAGSGK